MQDAGLGTADRDVSAQRTHLEPLAKVSSTKPPVRLQRLMHETPGKIYRAVCYFALLPAVINIKIDVR